MEQQKNLPQLRFPGFEGEWERKKLLNLLSEGKLGGNYENSESNNGIPVIKMGNIGRGNIVLDKIQYLPENIEFNTEDILKEGDLLFNTRNTLELVGKVAIWKNELPLALYNSNILRLKFDQNIESSNRFMNYYFNTRKTIIQLRNFATGTTSVAAIYGRDLNQLKISFPSLSEQTRIATFFTEIDRKIGQLKQKKTLLEQYKKGVMQQLFSQTLRFKDDNGNEFPIWEKKRLGEVLNISNGITKEQNDTPQGFKVTRIETISDGTINLDKVGYVDYINNIEEYKIKKGYILYSNINSVSHIGKTAIALTDLELYHGMNLLCLKCKNEINSLFIYYCLNSVKIRNYFKSICNKAVNQASINQTELSKTEINLPLLPEQTKIANFLSAIDDKINHCQQQMEGMEAWKRGALQGMFV